MPYTWIIIFKQHNENISGVNYQNPPKVTALVTHTKDRYKYCYYNII